MNRSVLQKLRPWRKYLVAVALPTVLLALFYALWCSPRYVSQATVLVQQESGGAMPTIELGLLSIGGGASSYDARLTQAFVLSPAMLQYLDDTLQLRQHYSDNNIDVFSRLPADASRERFFAYYLKHVTVTIDESAMTLTIDVQAFDRPYAQKLLDAIVKRSEEFVNEVSHSMAREQIEFVRGELNAANERLRTTSQELIRMQQENRVLSPMAETSLVSGIIAGLQQQVATEQTTLRSLQSYLSPTAPEVIASRKRLQAFQAQIEQERARQLGMSSKDPAMNALQLRFSEQELAVKLATDLYQSSLASLESTRVEASRKLKYVVMVSPPTLPDQSTEPRAAFIVVSAFAILNLLYLIASLLVATIRDHQE